MRRSPSEQAVPRPDTQSARHDFEIAIVGQCDIINSVGKWIENQRDRCVLLKWYAKKNSFRTRKSRIIHNEKTCSFCWNREVGSMDVCRTELIAILAS